MKFYPVSCIPSVSLFINIIHVVPTNKVTYQRPKNPECSIKMRMDFKTVLRKTCMRVKRGEGVQDKELYKC